MIELTINGKSAVVAEGATVLEAVRQAGFNVPTLCHHPALEPYGACRVCMVEVERRGYKSLVTACTVPAAKGMAVFTDSPEVLHARKFSLKLLLMMAPQAERIRALAAENGVTEPFPSRHGDQNCIRCGLCVRVCKELIGKEAIGFVERGTDRIPETPFREDNTTCITCGSCFHLCPTGKVKLQDKADREMETWHRKTKRVSCPDCGELFLPMIQILDAKKRVTDPDLGKNFDLCPSCRRTKIMRTMIDL